MSRGRLALAGIVLLLVGCAGMEGLNIAGIPVGGIMQTGSQFAASTVDMDEPEEIELGRATSALIGSKLFAAARRGAHPLRRPGRQRGRAALGPA